MRTARGAAREAISKRRAPATVLTEERLAAAERELRRAIDDRAAPGLAAATGVGDTTAARWFMGFANTDPADRRAVQTDTVFDLASLTKVAATLPCLLSLVVDGAVSLDAPVNRYLPRFRHEGVTVRHLLTHSSGLPACFAAPPTVAGSDELMDEIYRLDLETSPGARVRYSDIGFIVLGALVEQLTGADLQTSARVRVFDALHMSARFVPPPEWRGRCAATEFVDGRPVVGRVHDEIASAVGGICGHAGLFATVDDMQTYAMSWAGGSGLLPVSLRAEAVRCQTAGRNGARGLGWVCRGDQHDVVTPGWGAEAVCHTGFTGTSLAVDPVSHLWAVLLTNAVHFGRNRRQPVRAMRERFHAALVGDPLSP